jgi:hypothetical protein
MTIGRVVLDEIPLEITGIQFRCGQVFVTARTTAHSKVHLDPDAELTLFAPDGTVVIHRPSRTRGKVVKVDRFDSVDLTWRWQLTPLSDDDPPAEVVR